MLEGHSIDNSELAELLLIRQTFTLFPIRDNGAGLTNQQRNLLLGESDLVTGLCQPLPRSVPPPVTVSTPS